MKALKKITVKKVASDNTKEDVLRAIKDRKSFCINYDDIDCLPIREDFLDGENNDIIEQMINKGQPIPFLPITFNEYMDGYNYVIECTGVVINGTKLSLIIKGARLFLDVRVPENMAPKDLFEKLIEHKIIYSGTSHQIKNLFPFQYFHANPVPYLRIYFKNIRARSAVKNKLDKTLIDDQILEYASDDRIFMKKVLRDNRLRTAGWNIMRKYRAKIIKCNENKEDQGKNIKSDCIFAEINIENIKRFKKRDINLIPEKIRPNLLKDPTIVGMWDIETFKFKNKGVIPDAEDPKSFVLFMICISFGFHHENLPFYNFCAVNKPCANFDNVPDVDANIPGTIIVQCANEIEVILAFFNVLAKMNPDILGAFNGSHFDWPMLLAKANQYKLGINDIYTREGSRDKPGETLQRNLFHFIPGNKFCVKRSELIKIDPETMHNSDAVIVCSSFVDTDVMPIFLKRYSKMEIRKAESLNFFLKENKIEQKADLSYHELDRIYAEAELANAAESWRNNVKEKNETPINEISREQSAQDMARVAYYCIIDCVRPFQLYSKCNVVLERRELADLAYVTLYDAFYRADGMKVHSLCAECCNRNGYAYRVTPKQMSDSERNHYPGAWVAAPNRGLHADNLVAIQNENGKIEYVQGRPIGGEDFASLYPSEIMTYNLSPDMIVMEENEARELERNGYVLHRIEEFEYEVGPEKGAAGNRKYKASGWSVRHNGLYTKNATNIIVDWKEVDAKSESAKDSDIMFQGSRAFKPVYGRAKYPGERMGIFPIVLRILLEKRAPLKQKEINLRLLKERMLKEGIDLVEVDGYKVDADGVEYFAKTTNSKQLALKVLANTFYGDSGNFRSANFNVLVAAGVTAAGRASIRMAAQYALSRNFRLHYGDTDSMYLSCHDSVFEECDRKWRDKSNKIIEKIGYDPLDGFAREDEHPNYESEKYLINLAQRKKAPPKEWLDARIEWWTEMVRITRNKLEELKNELADLFRRETGLLHLHMAYEEVGYPTVLCGKKQYFMTPHIKNINFYSGEIMIRGIRVVRQGQAEITKEIGYEFMRRVLRPENLLTPFEILRELLDGYFAMNENVSNINLYKLTARYRAAKKNMAVKKFMVLSSIFSDRYLNAPPVNKIEEEARKICFTPEIMNRCKLPEDGDKFNYVVCSVPCLVDFRLVKTHFSSYAQRTVSKGERMIEISAFEAWNNYARMTGKKTLSIDFEYYFNSGLVGLCSRYLAYHPMFRTDEYKDVIITDENYYEFDSACMKAAENYYTSLYSLKTGEKSSLIMKLFARFEDAFYCRCREKLGNDFVCRILNLAGKENNVGKKIEEKFGWTIVGPPKEIHKIAKFYLNVCKHYVTFGKKFPDGTRAQPLFDYDKTEKNELWVWGEIEKCIRAGYEPPISLEDRIKIGELIRVNIIERQKSIENVIMLSKEIIRATERDLLGIFSNVGEMCGNIVQKNRNFIFEVQTECENISEIGLDREIKIANIVAAQLKSYEFDDLIAPLCEFKKEFEFIGSIIDEYKITIMNLSKYKFLGKIVRKWNNELLSDVERSGETEEGYSRSILENIKL